MSAGHDAALRGAAGYWVPLAISDLAESYIRAGEPEEAKKLLESVTSRLPMTTFPDRHLWLAKARLEIAGGNCTEAISIIDRLYQSTVHVTAPRDIPTLAEVRGIARVHAGEFDEALVDLTEALAGFRKRSNAGSIWRVQTQRALALDRVGNAEAADKARADDRRVVQEIAEGLPDEALRAEFLVRANGRIESPF